MAIDKAVDSAALDAGMLSVADAIRAKAGTTEPLAWPDGFAAAISGIETGGGDSAGSVIDKSVTSITSNVAEVGQYAFYGCEQLETVSFPMATKIQGGAFIGCKALVSVSAANATEIRSDVTKYFAIDADGNYRKDSIGTFKGCANLTTVNFPMAETIYSSAFSNCEGLTELKFPRVKTIGASDNAGGGGILE